VGTEFNNAGMGFTNDGGIYKTMINKTGAPTVLGTVIGPYKEIGHTLETVAAGGAGTYALCLCEIHFC